MCTRLAPEPNQSPRGLGDAIEKEDAKQPNYFHPYHTIDSLLCF